MKEVALRETGDTPVDWQRWQRSAVDASTRQIYGAERWLASATHVVRADGTRGIALPDRSSRRLHRVAIALGSMGSVPIVAGDLGKGFVHVFSEDAFDTLLAELDTVSDFTTYLLAKEQLVSATQVIVQGGEQNLLAMYLTDGRRLPTGRDVLMVDDGLWKHFIDRPEYQARKVADRESYVWDRLVTLCSEDVLHGRLEIGATLDDNERAVRTMARETRFERRILGREFLAFFGDGNVRSRIVPSPSGTIYVFLKRPHGYPRDVRIAELGNRCFVARGLHPKSTTSVGIATEEYAAGRGFSIDLLHLHVPQWSSADQAHLEGLQATLGYFSDSLERRISDDEYPGTTQHP